MNAMCQRPTGSVFALIPSSPFADTGEKSIRLYRTKKFAKIANAFHGGRGLVEEVSVWDAEVGDSRAAMESPPLVTSTRDRLKTVLAAHVPNGRKESYCLCGVYLDERWGSEKFEDHRVDAVLAATYEGSEP